MLPSSSKAVLFFFFLFSHVNLFILVCSMWHCILFNVIVLFEFPSPRTCLPRECFGFIWKSVYEILCFYSIPWKLQVCCTYCQQLSCKLRHTFTMRLQIKLFYLRPYQVWLCWWAGVLQCLPFGFGCMLDFVNVDFVSYCVNQTLYNVQKFPVKILL